LIELHDAQEEQKQHQLPSEEWQRHDRDYHEALEESERIRGRIRATRGEQGRLKRIRSAIPIAARRRRLAQERDELGDVVRLRDLGRPTDLDEAETWRLRADEPAIIRTLGQRLAELRGQTEEARRTIARHEDQIRRQEKELADLEKPRDVEPLRRAVRQARKA